MSVELVTLLFFGSLLFFLFIGTPLAFTLGGISVVYQPATDGRASALALRHGIGRNSRDAEEAGKVDDSAQACR